MDRGAAVVGRRAALGSRGAALGGRGRGLGDGHSLPSAAHRAARGSDRNVGRLHGAGQAIDRTLAKQRPGPRLGRGLRLGLGRGLGLRLGRGLGMGRGGRYLLVLVGNQSSEELTRAGATLTR